MGTAEKHRTSLCAGFWVGGSSSSGDAGGGDGDHHMDMRGGGYGSGGSVLELEQEHGNSGGHLSSFLEAGRRATTAETSAAEAIGVAS
jgi:hypothetical protein